MYADKVIEFEYFDYQVNTVVHAHHTVSKASNKPDYCDTGIESAIANPS